MSPSSHANALTQHLPERSIAGLLDAPPAILLEAMRCTFLPSPDHTPSHPQSVEDCLTLLDDLRRMTELIDNILLPDAPPCWSAEELAHLSWLAHKMLAQLVTAATPEIQAAYAAHLARING
jgi:hypothetical protein